MTSRVRGVLPLLLVLFINALGYGLLFFQKQENRWEIIQYGIAVSVLILISFLVIQLASMGDPYLFLIVSLLLSVGIMMQLRLGMKNGRHQFYWFVVSIVVFFISYFVYRAVKVWDSLGIYYVAASVALFMGTLLLGKSVNGARNWIKVGGFSFQPSELIKILYIFALACFFTNEYIENNKNIITRMYGAKNGRQLIIAAVVYINLGFLVLQKEWGLALLFFAIYFCLLYVYGTNLLFVLANLALAAGGGWMGYRTMHHIQERVEIWLHPFADPWGDGHQIVQSMVAIGSGGFTGSGIGMGRPGAIPEHNSDFIFASICEEMGILGGMAIIMLFFMFVYRGFKISLSVTNLFHKVVALGITTMYGFQTFIIIGGVIKFIPLTGITLPFISYGGSSLLTSFMALGILQAISSRKEDLSDDI